MRIAYFIASCLLCILIVYGSTHLKYKDQNKPDFYFEVVSEELPTKLSRVAKAKIFLPASNYSKDNLTLLFMWHGGKYQDADLFISAAVYTDLSRLKADITDESLGYGFREGRFQRPSKEQYPQREILFDAFYRKEPEYEGAQVRHNEIYSYCPDLNFPNNVTTVVLKGRDRFADKSR